MWPIWLSILCALPLLVAAEDGLNDQLLIKADAGSFRGKLSSDTVRSWLGVPFGASTGGELRFQPPQPARKLPEGVVYNATNYGIGCPQNKGPAYVASEALLGGVSTGAFAEGDDCLNLNIWAPTVNRTNGSLAAVLVWIYGGGGLSGGSAAPFFDGNNFIRDQEGIILVSFNYRTNIFAMSPRGERWNNSSVYNPGLLDQRLALEWVRANIKQFGGDVNRITLFGESAGAGAVGIWPYAYRDDPIAAGLIMQSGTETVFDPLGTGVNNTSLDLAWDDVATRAGCPDNSRNDTSQLECLREVPWQIIQGAVVTSNLSSSLSGSTVDNITLFTPQEYQRRRATGDFARIPVLVGTNSDEGALFAPFLGSSLGVNITTDLITLYGFACPAAVVAFSRTNYNVTAYQYRYSGQFPNLNPSPGLGAYHSAEIPVVFGTYNKSTIAPPTAQEVQTSEYIQGVWAEFARNPQSGLNEYGWKTWQKDGTTLNQIGVANKSGVVLQRTTAYNDGCALLFPELGP